MYANFIDVGGVRLLGTERVHNNTKACSKLKTNQKVKNKKLAPEGAKL